MWKGFWKTKLPPKIKMCGWNVYHDILTTLSNLNKQGMDVWPLCYLCREKTETTSHLFWECKSTRGLWLKYFSNTNLECFIGRKEWSVPNFCESFWKNSRDGLLIDQNLRKFLIICWKIWATWNSMSQKPEGQPRISTRINSTGDWQSHSWVYERKRRNVPEETDNHSPPPHSIDGVDQVELNPKRSLGNKLWFLLEWGQASWRTRLDSTQLERSPVDGGISTYQSTMEDLLARIYGD